jgi:hypothetical protein
MRRSRGLGDVYKRQALARAKRVSGSMLFFLSPL